MKKLLAALLLFSLYACKRDKSLCTGETTVIEEQNFSVTGLPPRSPVPYRIDTVFFVGKNIVFDLVHDSTYRPVCQTIYVCGNNCFRPVIMGDVASTKKVRERHRLPLEVDYTRSPDTTQVIVVAYDSDSTVYLTYAY